MFRKKIELERAVERGVEEAGGGYGIENNKGDEGDRGGTKRRKDN